MQPEGPYRFTELVGECPVGKAWSAEDEYGRMLTVAILDPAVAGDPRWRQAFEVAANTMAQPQTGDMPYVNADFAAQQPWVAYSVGRGPGAERLFQSLGMELRPGAGASVGPAIPQSPVSGPPVSAPPASVPPAATASPSYGPIQRPTSGSPLTAWAPSEPNSGASSTPAASSADPLPANPMDSTGVRFPDTPPPRRHRFRLLIVGLSTLALAAVAGGGIAWWTYSGDGPPGPGPSQIDAWNTAPVTEDLQPGIRPWTQAAPYSADERALAVAAPGLVFVEASFTGFVREAKTNVPLSRSAVTFKRRCTGFVINPEGQIITNGQCVQPSDDAARERALYTLGRILVEQKKLQSDALDQFVRSKLPNTRFTGVDPATPFTSEVFGQLNVAKGDLAASPAIPGRVVRTLGPDAGDLALVKLAQGALPTVQLNAQAATLPGSSLLVLAYNTEDTDFRAATYTQVSKSVRVTTVGNQGAVQTSRINDDIGIYSNGGVAIDHEGRVVGILGSDLGNGANRVVVPSSTAVALLAEAGGTNSLSKADQQYRSGLDAFFSGENSEAIAQFDQVVEGSPANLLARVYRQSAADRGRLQGGSAGSGRLASALVGGMGGALSVGLVALVVLIVRRRRDYAASTR